MAGSLVIAAEKIQKPHCGFIHASKPTFLTSFKLGITSWVSTAIPRHVVLLVVANRGHQFVGLDAFQKQNIEAMDHKCIWDQQAAILALEKDRPFDEIVAGIPCLLEAYCAILWPAVAQMMGGIYNENQALTSRQIAEAPLWLTKSADRVVPFYFCDIGVWKTRKMWIVGVGLKI